MPDEMEEIIAEFITEAEESLDKIDPLFIELEARGQDREILNEIFRSMHTLKGAAGFLGFQQIVDVSHRAENILKKLREGEMPLIPALTDVILKSVDTLKVLISHIKHKDSISEDITGILKELENALELGLTAKPEDKGEENHVLEPVNIQQPLSEDQPPPAAKEKEVVSTLRVDVERVDKVFDLAGEIVLLRNRLLNLAAKLDKTYSGDTAVESFLETAGFLDRVTADLHLAIMKMRMQPISKVFNKFPRMVRDMSKTLGKEIELEVYGEETEVDKSVVETIGDPLVHIIRNSIDHGIETAVERELQGKHKKGKIVLGAYQKGTQIVIEVSDDGKGIDIESVKRKALNKGLITEEDAQKMTDDNAVNLIFLPGFSTKEKSTELSGRGVGMDVVKTNASKLNGYVEVITKKGAGSSFRISLPLTLAIIQAMMVRIGSEIYAVPQSIIEEAIRVTHQEVKNVTGQRVLNIRGNVLPVFEMSEVLGIRGNYKRGESGLLNDNSYLLVASIGEKKLCLLVDELLGQEEIVIKTINGVDSEECGILGATITGDGKVILILDLPVLARGLFRMSSKVI